MENKTPEWVPDGADKKLFASSVMPGLNLRKDEAHDDTISWKPRPKRRELSLEGYKEGVLSCNKTILARAITLIESNSDAHFEKAQELLASLLPYSGKSFRIGITGVPGAGKSTFIEAFGTARNLARRLRSWLSIRRARLPEEAFSATRREWKTSRAAKTRLFGLRRRAGCLVGSREKAGKLCFYAKQPGMKLSL